MGCGGDKGRQRLSWGVEERKWCDLHWLKVKVATDSRAASDGGSFWKHLFIPHFGPVVFGEKAFEKFGKGFMSMHFSDQHLGKHKKMLVFKFALPGANHMADMTRLVALVPYYIDLVGRYKLSSQARSKTDAARSKAAQEAYKELQNARQEALQKRKADRRKILEEAEAKLSAEAIRKKEAKERARQLKKAMPKVKMTRAG
ncbi:unnamed protein product [Ilex paraguariensis]|uniref:Uncharacterized protein n=1 Tax=Ilex paraguariensis TaxID=185542 RepID=A0ABC8T8F8_9AQUA